MGYHQNGPLVGLKRLLNDLLGNKIHVVCRFIENQHIAILKHQYGKGQLCLLTTAEIAHFFKDILSRQKHRPQSGTDFLLFLGGMPPPEFLQNGIIRIDPGILLVKIGNFNMTAPLHRSFQHRDKPLYCLEQRRFSHTVGANQADFVPPHQIQIQMPRQHFGTGSPSYLQCEIPHVQHIFHRLPLKRKSDFGWF